jgi:RHS repeat-associated protein
VPGGETINPRWVTSGWTILNNKGKPVRQYEPFFDDTHDFKFGVTVGVSPILFYDPAGRVVATLHPDHTWQKVLFDPWRTESWDVNDTLLIDDPKTDSDAGSFFARLPDSDYLPGWYGHRQSGVLGPEEQDAARKSAVHANTPAIAYADSLGRAFLTVAHNKFKYNDSISGDPPIEEFHRTRVVVDIEGNQRAVIDAKDRIVMRYDYDMLGTHIHQASLEGGERWMLEDVAGKPIRAWDSRDHTVRTEYDELRRPVRSFVQGADPQHLEAEILFAKTEYGEGRANALQLNLRAKPFRQSDSAGLATSEAYDFKGNLLQTSRRLAKNYRTIPNWSANPDLELQTFASGTTYDALNRPRSVTTPDQSVYRPAFNEANLLEKVDVNLRGAPTATSFVTNIDYDAKGRRLLIEYHNRVKTEYSYDPVTFRLNNLKTTRVTDQTKLQDLSYIYDSAGNITQIQDNAQQTIYFNNQVVPASSDYTYDAISRLINAEGREHIGQTSFDSNPPDGNYRDYPFVGHQVHSNDGQAMRRYMERYEYDPVGNFLQLIHQATNGNWTRSYVYNQASFIEPGKNSNRLGYTTVGGNNPELYSYDAHGNMIGMPHLTLMEWDFNDQLQATSRQVVNSGTPETTYYVYNAAGQRMRKVTERQSGKRKNERVYVGGFEVYREYDGSGAGIVLERETLHVMDDKQRVALVETRTDGSLEKLIRYQFGNHLGSASLELDNTGQIVSYEEYHPYGTTSYQAGPSAAEVSLKRYRYTGIERDEETGLNFHAARYCAPWLARWVSADPIGLSGGLNQYRYANANPLQFHDRTGLQPEDAGVWVPGTAGPEDVGTFVPQADLDRANTMLKVAAAPITIPVGVAYGAGKTLVRVVIAPGKATYYGTSYLLYQCTGNDIWEDQAGTFEEGVNNIGDTLSHPWESTKSYVRNRGDAIVQSWTRAEFFDAAAATGETGAELYLFAEAVGKISPPKFTSAPMAVSRVAVAASPAIAVSGIDVGLLAAPVSLIASRAASSKSGGKSGSGTSGSGSKPASRQYPPSTGQAASSRGVFMDRALRTILKDPKHPLRFLVNPKTNNWWARSHLSEEPTVQAGHLTSRHSGAAERYGVEDAAFNQWSSNKGETQGAVFQKSAVDVDGVPVEARTAQQWQRMGKIP